MSVWFQAPWDLIQATVQLPSPQQGDLTNNQSEVNIRNSMNGTLYSYVKSTNRVKKTWDFLITRQKSLELEQFIEHYSELELRVIDWNEYVYRFFIINNPIDFTRISKDNFTNVRLELEGIRIL